MTQKNKISVIVPVYKVEEYLDQCVGSIVAQTYENLEIILVDDGSPDRCGAMCDAWGEKDSRIRVIHKENGGLSDARNAGLAAATGEFIGFVDSDDWIEPDMYQALHARMLETGSDISACGVEMVWPDGSAKPLTLSGEILLDNPAAMEAVIREDWLKQPVWYKLYRHSILGGIRFETGKCHEDVFWTYRVVARAGRICVFDTPLYCYRQRFGSIMGSGFSEKRLDALEAKALRQAFVQNSYPELADLARNDLFYSAAYMMQLALRNSDTAPGIREEILDYAKTYSLVAQSGKEKLWEVLWKLSFTGTCRLRNLLGVGL